MSYRLLWIVAALASVAFPAPAQQAERVVGPVSVSGVVFLDRNRDGTQNPGEPGLAGVAVSDQVTVTRTDSIGRFQLNATGYGLVFVAPPNGHLSLGPFWRKVEAGNQLAFPLVSIPAVTSFSFLHASDTHIHPGNVARTRRLRAITESVRPAFVLISGDLVRDALRVSEAEAKGYYDLLTAELSQFRVPVHTVPGNHEIFGIERHHSLVSESHPLYAKRMYRSYLGPNYYSFTYGGVHFVGLDTVDYDDLWYNGHVDSLQLGWLAADMAALPPGTPVVTFNHIPLVTAGEVINGFTDDGPAPTTIRLANKLYFRHVVRNTAAVLDIIGARLELALGGHMHRREMLRYETAFGSRRFHQTAAVTDPDRGEGPMGIRSGVTLYRVVKGKVDDGTFIPLNPD
jgi:predicted MPP superfamily phosphohydrolase